MSKWYFFKTLILVIIWSLTGFGQVPVSHATIDYSLLYINGKDGQSILVSGMLQADTSFSYYKKRPNKIILQYVAGSLAGGALTGLGVFIGSKLGYCKDEKWFCIDMNSLLFGILGFYIGDSGGVYFVGNDKLHHGSYGATLLGCFLGTVVETGFLAAIYEISHDPMPVYLGILSVASLLIIPTTGAIIGYNMSVREGLIIASSGALLNFDNAFKTGYLGIPAPSLVKHMAPERPIYSLQVPVLSIRF